VLEELLVADLGVIERLTLTFGPGMTALTGETGAGKTLVVEAIDLLLGGRADPALVRPAAAEALVEGRFVESPVDGEHVEWVVRRVVPREGRSRAYLNGSLASTAELAALGARLVDVHGQHAHQSLLAGSAQRAALDRFAGVDLEPLRAAEAAVGALQRSLAELGGDERARARELELLRFQLGEIDAAGLDDPDEDAALEAEEDRLADALAHQEAAARAHAALAGDEGAVERLADALGAVRDRAPFAELSGRLAGLAVELDDIAAGLRDLGEAIEPDPERLDAVRARRKLLRDMCRKYGDTLAAVMAEADELRRRHDDLAAHEVRAAELEQQREGALAALRREQARVAKARQAAAPELARAVRAHLADLAMAKARLDVVVGPEPPGDDVTFHLAANPGAPLLPLAKVASGGELARTMLALRLVLSGGPPTQIFDEVDAGIGGAAATAVGEALARLGEERQVLVVTHLPQVAAWAATQVAVAKHDDGATTVSAARPLKADERLVELSRMLSGSPGSRTARRHAAELLDAVAAARRAW
jgi:DNA repair protein RecN (Recombination protein N)